MSEMVGGLNLTPGSLSLRFTPERTCYDHDDFRLDLQRILEDVRRRNEKEDVRLTMLADEVDVLNEYSESLNGHLHDILSSFSENLVAVMSGVAIKRSWQSDVSPWNGFFDEIELARFTREEAEALVRSPVSRVYRYHEAAVERIIELSGLRPYLIQKLCLHAVSRMLEDGRSTIQTGDVETAFEDVSARFQAEGIPR
jgi:histone H3/H4